MRPHGLTVADESIVTYRSSESDDLTWIGRG